MKLRIYQIQVRLKDSDYEVSYEESATCLFTEKDYPFKFVELIFNLMLIVVLKSQLGHKTKHQLEN